MNQSANRHALDNIALLLYISVVQQWTHGPLSALSEVHVSCNYMYLRAGVGGCRRQALGLVNYRVCALACDNE